MQKTASQQNPEYFETIEIINELEQKLENPDINDLKRALSRKHGREYTTEDVREHLKWLEKTPTSHKIVRKSLLREKVSLTEYGQQVLERR